MNRCPQLLLIRGACGAGKSTIAEHYGSQGFVAVSADDYFTHDGIYDFDSRKLPEAHKWCLNQTIHYLRLGRNVVVHNTFTTLKELNVYLNLSNIFYVQIHIYHVISQYIPTKPIPNYVIARHRNTYEPHWYEWDVTYDIATQQINFIKQTYVS
jgi:predicted kinase